MSGVSKVGFYVRTYDRDIFITESQKNVLYSAMDKGITYFDIDDTRVMVSQVKEVIPSAEYSKSVSGGHYCPKHPDNFVEKYKTCGYCGR